MQKTIFAMSLSLMLCNVSPAQKTKQQLYREHMERAAQIASRRSEEPKAPKVAPGVLPADSDNDGMPDTYETNVGLIPMTRPMHG